ncbi:uncharacterized protein LOC133900216 [Phragmites australis]|uniref:uncharacterized protein LOC133900216 n=1 Tax=Phragmites australis TaxID=29695 RepID=UPI002D769382|nr:uncharacterized protein LOC133900216 [Phragmites australis]
MAAEPQKATWEVPPQMDVRMASVLERIDFLHQARPPAEAPRLAPAPEPSAPEPSAPAELELPSALAETETQAPPSPERVAAAVPEQPAPAESAPNASSVGWSTSSWAVPTWQFSGTLSPSELARRGPSAQPSPSQPADPLPVVLRSAREMIGRLEAAVAGEMTQLEADRAALTAERARLVAGWRLLEARVAAARAANEGELRALEEEQKALEGTSAEATEAVLATAAREERAAKWESELTAHEQALSTLAERLKRVEAQVSGAAGGQGFEERLRRATEELEAAETERANVKWMMEDILRQMQRYS